MSKRHSADSLFTLLLLLLFLLAGAASLALGVRVWRAAEDGVQRQYALATPLQYLAGRVRQADGLRIERFADGTEAIAFNAELAGETYVTRLYCYNDSLCELFTPVDVTLTPADGAALLPAKSLHLSQEQATGLVRAQLTGQDGRTGEVLLAPRLGEGAAS